MGYQKRASAVAAVIALTLITASCAGPGESTIKDPSAGSAELQTVRLAELAGVPALFFAYGVQQGFFEEEGIDLVVDSSTGGAAVLPAIVSGGLDIAGSNMVSAMTAISKGLPLKMIGGGSVSEPGDKDWSGIIVAADSDIDDFGDLGGKKVAINTLRNVNDVVISAVAEREGADASTIEFVELRFPDMSAAVARGDVAAALLGEPFLTMATQTGDVKIMQPAYSSLKPYVQIGTFVTTAQYAQENPEIIDGFQAALVKTAESIAADQQKFRDALPVLGEFDAELANAINFPAWTGKLDRESVELLGGLMVKYGIIDEELAYDDIILD